MTRAEGLGLARLELVEPTAGVTTDQAIAALQQDPDVSYAEPNRTRHALLAPDDSLFGNQWGLANAGQSPPQTPADASPFSPGSGDIRAGAAWDQTTGSPGVVVGVVDTGVQTDHPDLAPNIWTNAAEVPGNGRDDDGNGQVDDVHGWNFVGHNNDPSDQVGASNPGHGTHVAGILGGRGNNGTGIAGVSWNTSIMPVRVLDQNGSGTLADVIAGYAYAARNGARIVNASLGDYAPAASEYDAIRNAPNTLFVVAAGNDGANNNSGDAASCADLAAAGGVQPPTQCSFPCNYGDHDTASTHLAATQQAWNSRQVLDNVICVAATNGNDQLADFSNFGPRFVDIAAPGVRIWSSLPGSSWGDLSGTSMATPFVTGVAALVLARHPGLTTAQLRQAVLEGIDHVGALSGVDATGGRLNAAAALAAGDAIAPPPPPPPPPAPVAVQSTALPRDTAAPVLVLNLGRRAKISTLLRRGLKVAVHCSEACKLTYRLVVDAKTAKRLHIKRTAATRRHTLAKAATDSASLKLPKALRRARSGAKLSLQIRAVDGAGNTVTRTVTVALRR